MKKNKEEKDEFSDVTLDGLARMVASGFLGVNDRIDGLDSRIDVLEEKVEKGFAEINSTLNLHVRDVRVQTDGLALRTKKLEETVFGVGKYPA